MRTAALLQRKRLSPLASRLSLVACREARACQRGGSRVEGRGSREEVLMILRGWLRLRRRSRLRGTQVPRSWRRWPRREQTQMTMTSGRKRTSRRLPPCCRAGVLLLLLLLLQCCRAGGSCPLLPSLTLTFSLVGG